MKINSFEIDDEKCVIFKINLHNLFVINVHRKIRHLLFFLVVHSNASLNKKEEDSVYRLFSFFKGCNIV